MEIELRFHFAVGEIHIPPGRYLVGLSRETSQVILSGRGKSHMVPATRRPAKRPIRYAEVLFQPGMSADLWVLTMRSPPRFEWVTFLQAIPPPAKKK